MTDNYLKAAREFYSKHLAQALSAIEDLQKEHASLKAKAGLDAQWIDVTNASIVHYERSVELYKATINAIEKKIAETE